MAIKQSVYVLPNSEQCFEDLSWILKEAREGGGEAYITRASFLEGISDEQVEEIFRRARDSDYGEIVEEAGGVSRKVTQSISNESVIQGESIASARAQFFRLKRRFESIVGIDFFNAQRRGEAEGLLSSIDSCLKGAPVAAVEARKIYGELRGRTWVTRRGIYIDRIASAWLIKRFIDPQAAFRFVEESGYRPIPGELRFDMFEGEYTHEGDRCACEVIINRFGLEDQALVQISEIVHDMDMKDDKFGRSEASGLGVIFSGLSALHPDDESRLERGFAVMEELYEFFAKKT